MRFFRVLTLLVFTAMASPAFATPIEFRINFTQTFFHPNFGARDFNGSFFLDDTTFGPGFENQSFGPFSAAMSLLTDFTVTLGGSTVYDFDLGFTRAIGAPPISSVIALDAAGEVFDIQGGLTRLGTISQVILGRKGQDGEYVDVQQIDRFSSFPVSRGTYSIDRVDLPNISVSEPPISMVFAIGLAGLCFWRRRQIHAVWTEHG